MNWAGKYNASVLWEYTLPAAPEGVPAVYESDGREFIIVPVGGGSVLEPSGGQALPSADPAQYVVFSLPK